MKKITMLVLSCSILLLNACDNKTRDATETYAIGAATSIDEKDMTGNFTVGDKTFSGKVSVQTFAATGQFSVLCQDDTDPSLPKLIQFIFKDEASARAGGNKTPAYDQGTDQTTAEASVIFELNYKSVEESTGIITVNKNGSNNEIVFKDLKLKTMSKEEVIVAGTIPF